ncbi:MAG: hypothetical protein IPO86_09110 [Saprospiraceae bacterium]|nr:hypothetical protein [Saprospiraceae bacterium]
MTKHELRFERYADDFNIYVKTKEKAREVGNTKYLFLKEKLFLPINQDKSRLIKPVQFTILGFKFVTTYIKDDLTLNTSWCFSLT